MIFDSIVGLFSKDVGIDLGTANTLVYVRGEGIVLSEPSVVAIDKQTKRVLETPDGPAVGVIARRMLARTPDGIEAIRPLRDGRIARFDVTEAMLKYFITKVHKRKYAVSPRVVVAVPSGITEVEERAVFNCTERAGARRVYLIKEPLAAGIGAGLPIQDPVASMVVDVGGGTTEVAVISLSQIASSESVRVGGDEMDEAIISHMKDAHNLIVGEVTAEQLKIRIGSAMPLAEELASDVAGRDAATGLPRRVEVNSVEIREALGRPLSEILRAIKGTLEKTKPELAADLVERGIVLCGGGSLLPGIAQLVANEMGLPVRPAPDPMRAVALGTGIFLENIESYRASLTYAEAA